MKNIIVFILCIGFFITVFNDQDRTLNCYLYWVDHPFGFNSPANVFGGEMDAQESQDLFMEYRPGDYVVLWEDYKNGNWKHSHSFSVNSDAKKVTLKPYKVVIK